MNLGISIKGYALRIVFLLAVCLCALCGTAMAEEALPPQSVWDISPDSAVMLNAETGEILYDQNADELEYPASMTKMMTCILAIENGDLDSAVTVSSVAADVESTRVRPGQQVMLRELLYQLMLISDNGAASAIGEHLGGSIEGFAEMMNAKVRELGLKHTHFVNANGMPDANHYSTARDMAQIAAYCMKNPTFRQIVGTKAKTVYYLYPAGHTAYCENTNELLYSYSGCTGIKTGWTRAAGGCLAASAKRGNTELIVVVMNSLDHDARFDDAATLLDYGFSYFRNGSRNEDG